MSVIGFEPLIGREPELASVDRLLDSLVEDAEPDALPRARALLLVGDAGVGKTTLARAILARAAERGLVGAEGHCLDLATGTPFGPVVEALRQVLASRSAHSTSVPAAARWLAGDTMGSGDVLERLVAAAAAMAVEQALVLVVEDLDWSDRSTRDFALALVRTCRARVLLVGTVRSDDLSAEHPGRSAISELALSPGAVRLELAPLDAAGVAELARRVLGHGLSPVELATMMSRSGGNPLHAEEIITRRSAGYRSLEDLWRRAHTPVAALERLAEADAFRALGLDRRQALWAIKGLSDTRLPLFDDLPEGCGVYFVHGYHVEPADESVIATTTDYGRPFVSSIWRDNVMATQFHPEKSQTVGLKILSNFAQM
jgi:hypothetical protein